MPNVELLSGRQVQLEMIDANAHSTGLGEHLCGTKNAHLWKHIPLPDIVDSESLFKVLSYTARSLGWRSFAIRDLESSEICGTVSLMRIRAEHGSAEVGSVVYGSTLQRSRAGTEVIYLLAQYLFDDLKYRRFEWKCDFQNDASKNAASRYGFTFEGVFRNDMIVDGRNRDTAWFAMTDADWEKCKPAFRQWLSDSNFDSSGRQFKSLTEFRTD